MRWPIDSSRPPGITVERIDEALEDEAWAWLRIDDERPYSFVDATSFVLMRKLRIREALPSTASSRPPRSSSCARSFPLGRLR